MERLKDILAWVYIIGALGIWVIGVALIVILIAGVIGIDLVPSWHWVI